MRIVLVQQRAAQGQPTENAARGLNAVRCAHDQAADLVVFPELWQIGYAPCPAEPAARAAWLRLAIDDGDPWLAGFCAEAARLSLPLVVTFLHRTGAGPASAAAVIGADGAVALIHHKVHVADFTWETVLRPGEAFRTANVTTRAGKIRLGVMTCFDREFPESARALALAGAELIVCPNACLLCDDRIGQFRARAFENMTAVALANYPVPLMNGRSCVFDGIAVRKNRPRDHSLVMAGPRAALVGADLNLPALREYRATGLWRSDRRRPVAYQALTRAQPRPTGMSR
jgi:predicted amidohydrolase